MRFTVMGHDLLELGSDGRADLAQRRLDSAKLCHSSFSRLLPRVGYQPTVDNIETDGATRLSLAAACHTARAGYRFIRRRRLRR